MKGTSRAVWLAAGTWATMMVAGCGYATLPLAEEADSLRPTVYLYAEKGAADPANPEAKTDRMVAVVLPPPERPPMPSPTDPHPRPEAELQLAERPPALEPIPAPTNPSNRPTGTIPSVGETACARCFEKPLMVMPEPDPIPVAASEKSEPTGPDSKPEPKEGTESATNSVVQATATRQPPPMARPTRPEPVPPGEPARVEELPSPAPASVPTESKPNAEKDAETSESASPAEPDAAPARYGHAADYRWLCGELQYSTIAKGWRLRYADLGQVDPHGGSVTLLDDPRLEELGDGRFVRVRGRLLVHEGKSIAPPYQIDDIEPIE